MSAGDHPSARSLPERPDLEQYRTQAKDLVKAHGAEDTAAALRIADWLPRLQGPDPTAGPAAPFARHFP